MLRYVVSRTIQRFLSTYLEDLDVESISLKIPGFDADWSGGLDLKNVQLKAGAEIYSTERHVPSDSNETAKTRRMEKVKVLIGEGGEIGRLSVSGDFQDMSISVEDVMVTIDAVRSLTPYIEQYSYEDNTEYNGGRKVSLDENIESESDNFSMSNVSNQMPDQPNYESNGDCGEGTIQADPLLKLLAGLDINLKNVRVRLAIYDNVDDDKFDSSADTNDSDDYRKAGIPTIIELGIRDMVLTSEQQPDNDGIFSTFFRKKLSIGGGNIGVWMKIISTPADFLVPPTLNLRRSRSMQHSDVYWARSHWESLHLFQCSEINVLIQFCLDDESDDVLDQQSIGFNAYNDLGDFDSVLFGMNVAPQSDPLSHKYSHKRPPIEHIPLKSNFHRVSRGLRRRVIPGSNVMADDPSSWGCTYKHPLDTRMPVPGLIIHFSSLAPIEVNICRRCVDAFNSIRAVFSQRQDLSHQSDTITDDDTISQSSEDGLLSPDNTKSTLTSVSSNRHVHFSLVESTRILYDDMMYPDFMQPHNITAVGMELSKVIVRTQIMDENNALGNESGYSFGFIEFSLYSITLDLHRLSAKELSFIDSRVEVGRCDLNAYKGTERQKILTAGFTYPPGKAPSQPIQRVNAAERILEVSPLAVSSTPQNAALHFCYFSVSASDKANPGGCIEVKLGAFDTHIRDKTFGEIKASLKVVKTVVLGKSLEKEQPLATKPPTDMAADRAAIKNDDWGYTLTTDGGTLNW